MKVTIEGNRVDDFPYLDDDPKFVEELKKCVIRRLELRDEDTVEIVFTEKAVVCPQPCSADPSGCNTCRRG